MLEIEITPRFNELDALGHVNNAVFLQWFEQARTPLFEIFTPDLDPDKWRLIIARNEIDYLRPVNLGEKVLIKTSLSKIGNSSMHIRHQCLANDQLAAQGTSVMIHYDYKEKKSIAIGKIEREKLAQFLV